MGTLGSLHVALFRAWCVCRISGGLPLAVWGAGGVVELLARCPGCGMTLVGARHVLQECPDIEAHRRGLPLGARGVEALWALTGDAEPEALRKKVRFVGACMAQLVHRLTGRRPARDGAEDQEVGGAEIH